MILWACSSAEERLLRKLEAAGSNPARSKNIKSKVCSCLRDLFLAEHGAGALRRRALFSLFSLFSFCAFSLFSARCTLKIMRVLHHVYEKYNVCVFASCIFLILYALARRLVFNISNYNKKRI